MGTSRLETQPVLLELGLLETSLHSACTVVGIKRIVRITHTAKTRESEATLSPEPSHETRPCSPYRWSFAFVQSSCERVLVVTQACRREVHQPRFVHIRNSKAGVLGGMRSIRRVGGTVRLLVRREACS